MKKINIKTLKVMLISGANNLYNHHFEVDKLNIFPVPDGDTGTNMNLTMMNGIKELNYNKYNNFKSFANNFSRGLMMGARGNSGVILSQIFRGFFQNIKTKNMKNNFISNEDLLKSWKSAQDYAYRAVIKPVEGTILTIIKDASNYINEIEIKNKDSLYIFEKLLEKMNQSLKKTPDLLPILKKVGVVDSGGAGLVYIIEGMVYGLKYGKSILPKTKLENNNLTKTKYFLNQKKFGYCLEAIIKLNKIDNFDFNLNRIRNDLEKMNNQSIVLVHDNDLIKVHVHTLIPIQILNYFQKLGEIVNAKIENMTEQAKAHIQTIKPIRKLNNKFALIAAVPGKGIGKFFKEELKVNNIILYSKKINPSTDDFLKAIEIVDAKYIFILPNDNNLFLVAEQAKKIEKKSKVFVLPSKNIAQGMRAALNFDSNLTPKENKKNMRSEIKHTAFGYITIADRDVEIDNIKIKKNHFFSAISFRNKDGKEKVIVSNKNLFNAIEMLFTKLIWDDAEIITIFKGKNYLKDQINFIKKILDKKYEIEYEIIDGDQEIYNFLFVVE